MACHRFRIIISSLKMTKLIVKWQWQATLNILFLGWKFMDNFAWEKYALAGYNWSRYVPYVYIWVVWVRILSFNVCLQKYTLNGPPLLTCFMYFSLYILLFTFIFSSWICLFIFLFESTASKYFIGFERGRKNGV